MFTELMPLLRQRAVMITISDVGQDVPLVGLERPHSNIQRNHCRPWVLDPHQSSQVVETPCGPDVKVFQDGGILKLNLLDVVIEVQRDQRLYGSRPEQLSLQDFGRLASPSPHRVGVCVVHSCLDYSRRYERWRYGLRMVRAGFGERIPTFQGRKES